MKKISKTILLSTVLLTTLSSCSLQDIFNKITNCTCTFNNYDGSLLYETTISVGDDVVYGGDTPTKSSDDTYRYVFNGWDNSLTNILKDTTFVAQYKSVSLDIFNDFTPFTNSETYGYEYLSTRSDADDCLSFYKDLYNACINFENDGTIYVNSSSSDYYWAEIDCSDYPSISQDSFEDFYSCVIEVFRSDNPQKYYLIPEAGSDSTNTYLYLSLDSDIAGNGEVYSKNTYISNINKKLDSYINTAVNNAKNYSSDNDKAYYLYNMLINDVNYATTNGEATSNWWAHSIVGVVTEKRVVCEGYALMYALLCNYSGIRCIVGFGATDASKPYDTGHAWNYTYIDNCWYCIDSTWGDSSKKEDYYYKLDYATFKQDHILGAGSSFYFEVPSPIY